MYDVKNEKSPGFSYQRLSPSTIRRRNRLRILAGVLVGFALFYDCFLPHHKVKKHPKLVTQHPVCPQSPIGNDVLLVVRTGTTEVHERLPVHFNTTLHCVSNYVVYSDHEESVYGHHVYNALEDVSDALKASAPEFKLYESQRLQIRHRQNSTGSFQSSQFESLEDLSRKLDRFKFLPMLAKAHQHRPQAKWFVFIEADTYLVWQNLLEYLSKLDAQQDFYIGRHTYVGDVLFAHSGSGFVLSHAAMQKVTKHWETHVAEYDDYTVKSSTGDIVLGKALLDVGVPLFSAFPHFQSEAVSSLDHNVSMADRRPWCYAPITYHGMLPSEIRTFWAFEQEWQRRGKGVLRHRDVFKEYVVPGLATRVEHWDNFSVGGGHGKVGCVEACYAVCRADSTCLQYSYVGGKCSTSREIRYGSKVDTGVAARCVEYSTAASKCLRWQDDSRQDGAVQSGWMIERLSQYMEDMDSLCSDEEDGMWIV